MAQPATEQRCLEALGLAAIRLRNGRVGEVGGLLGRLDRASGHLAKQQKLPRGLLEQQPQFCRAVPPFPDRAVRRQELRQREGVAAPSLMRQRPREPPEPPTIGLS